MNTTRTPGTIGAINAAALAVASTALLTLKLGGAPNIPTIPPGVVILFGGAAIVLFGARWKWTAIVGAVVPGFLTVGAILTDDAVTQLSQPDETLLFAAMTVQLVALAVAVVSGVVAVIRAYRRPADNRAR